MSDVTIRQQMANDRTSSWHDHGRSIAAAFLVGVAGSILVVAFEKELRSLSRLAVFSLAMILIAAAFLATIPWKFAQIGQQLHGFRSKATAILAEVVLYLAPLLFVIASLLVVYATTNAQHDLLVFLTPFGPVIAGCGGALSICSVAASKIFWQRNFTWKRIRLETTLGLVAVVGSSVLNRMENPLDAWLIGLVAFNIGIHDMHQRFFEIAAAVEHIVNHNGRPARRKQRKS